MIRSMEHAMHEVERPLIKRETFTGFAALRAATLARHCRTEDGYARPNLPPSASSILPMC